MLYSLQPLRQDFQKDTFERLQEWRRNMKFIDTLIFCQSKTIGAHQIILASAIPYFEKLLSDTETHSCRNVHLDQLDPSSLMELIDFVYTGNLEVTEKNIEATIKTAGFLEMQNVKNSCVQLVLDSILNANNCIGWKRLAVNMDDKYFSERCDQFMKANITSVIRSPQIAATPQVNINLQMDLVLSGMEENNFAVQKLIPSIIQLLREVTNNSEQNVVMLTESNLYLHSTDGMSVALSEGHDSDENSPCSSPNKLNKMTPARHLDMGEDTSTTHIWQRIGMIQTSPTTFTVLTSLSSIIAILNITTTSADYPVSPTTGIANNIAASSSEFIASTNESRCSGGIVSDGEYVYVVGGYNRTSCLDTVEMYNKAENRWQYVSKLTTKRSRCAAVSLNGSLYALGGSDGHRDLDSMEVYMPETDQWKMVKAMMTEGKSSFGAVTLNGNIYVIGGAQMSYILPSMECYNPAKQQWTSLPDMNTSRNDLAVAVLGDKIYAIGGEQSTSGCTSSVECYNTKTSTWEFVAPLKTPRRGAYAVTYDGKIYVFGGCASAKVLDSVEVYDPTEDAWTQGAPMTLPRCSLIASVLNKQIMITGGFTGTTFLNTAEFYSPEKDQWTSFV
ncbi:influenza virus NS1A-binding protein homolog A-like [Dysidea avara]|uniref:influenza virus NS1A-binding protein homolog A-like n=1 Tax=Dysidea avara TaxID=196820 RepID=UPI00332DFBB7